MKDTLKQYIVPYSGLSLGKHLFQFQLDSTFFDTFSNEDIQGADISIDMEMEKTTQMLILELSFAGNFEVICSRCLQPYQQAVSGKERIIVKFGVGNDEEPDIIFLPLTETKIDLSEIFYEISILMLPIICVHPDSESGTSLCDPEMLKKLSEHSPQQNTDPRWDQLKSLMN